ncbi:hypothetical protein [Mesorhizobium sp. 43Arga]
MSDPFILNKLVCGIAGLAAALIAGHFGTDSFFRYLNRSAGLELRPTPKRLPPAVTGMFERALTFLLVVSDFPSFQNVILAWLAAKLAANWQRTEPTNSSDEDRLAYRSRALIAVMTGIVSIAFGYFGGRIAAAPWNFK